MEKDFNKLKKVRRKKINWFNELNKLDNPEYFKYFFKLLHRWRPTRRSTSLSFNRCAYNTLKHFYSTTTIDELKRKLEL